MRNLVENVMYGFSLPLFEFHCNVNKHLKIPQFIKKMIISRSIEF